MIDLSQEFHFTPTWTTEGKPCELRNGTLTGRWDPEGNDLIPPGLRISLEIGSATYCGTGPWSFSTPHFSDPGVVQCTALQAGVMEVGGMTVGPNRGDVISWSEPSSMGVDWPEMVLRPALWRASGREVGLVRVTAVDPWTWSAGDRLSFHVPAEHVQARGQLLTTLPVAQ